MLRRFTGRSASHAGVSWCVPFAQCPPASGFSLQRGHVVLPGHLGESSVEAGWRDGWAMDGRPWWLDGLHRPELREIGDHHAAASAGEGEHVLAKDAHQQLRSWDARWGLTCPLRKATCSVSPRFASAYSFGVIPSGELCGRTSL